MTNLTDELKNMKSFFKIELNKVGLEKYSFHYALMAEVSGIEKHDERNPLGKKWLQNPWRSGHRPDSFEPQFHNIVDFSMLVAPMPFPGMCRDIDGQPVDNRGLYEQFEERNGFSLFIYEWVSDDKYAAAEPLYVSKEIREREVTLLYYQGQLYLIPSRHPNGRQC